MSNKFPLILDSTKGVDVLWQPGRGHGSRNRLRSV